ncbi:MAG: GNAT family N-acetyltransferase, partial [Candidatus Rokuibacteriota bacterium]
MTREPETTVRRAQTGDLPALGRLGAQVLHTHYAFDRDRFMAPGRDPERGYARFLEGELREPDAIVLVAERGGIVAGYVYAGLEPRSW